MGITDGVKLNLTETKTPEIKEVKEEVKKEVKEGDKIDEAKSRMTTKEQKELAKNEKKLDGKNLTRKEKFATALVMLLIGGVITAATLGFIIGGETKN